MPVGMHRPQPSKWKSVLPFLLVLIIVPLLGWGASQLLTSRGVVSQESGASSVQSGSEQSGSQEGTPADEGEQSGPATTTPTTEPAPTPTPSESETPAAEVDYNVAISVLNGTGTQGFAASQSSLLNEAGFAGTSAANADNWQAASSTVYYSDPALEASAQEIARVLGIGAVATTDAADLGSADVVVLLR